MSGNGEEDAARLIEPECRVLRGGRHCDAGSQNCGQQKRRMDFHDERLRRAVAPPSRRTNARDCNSDALTMSFPNWPYASEFPVDPSGGGRRVAGRAPGHQINKIKDLAHESRRILADDVGRDQFGAHIVEQLLGLRKPCSAESPSFPRYRHRTNVDPSPTGQMAGRKRPSPEQAFKQRQL